jgi:hypothetical protein
MLRVILAEYMLRGSVSATTRLRAEFAANAPNCDVALLQDFAEDAFTGFSNIAFGLSCLAPTTPVHIGLFPTDDGMAPADYAAALSAAIAQVQAAGNPIDGVRMTWRIPSFIPAGLAFGLAVPGSIPQAQLLAECSEMAGRIAAMGSNLLATFPIDRPGSAWGAGSAAFSASLRDVARHMLGDRLLVGQLAFPDGYGPGSDILASPPCFAQLAAGEALEPAQTNAAAMGLTRLELHQGAQAAAA